jgi:hypothetical protein
MSGGTIQSRFGFDRDPSFLRLDQTLSRAEP